MFEKTRGYNQIKSLIKKNVLARNGNSGQLELEYILEFVCKTEKEKTIIKNIFFRKKLSGATIKRIRAFIQNTEKLHQAENPVIKKRKKIEKEIKRNLINKNTFWDGVSRWFKK